MSASNTAERTYAAVRQMLREGRLRSGSRLEASRLATELGVSPTPVRDVLQRLAGEQLIEARIGNGFHVPRFTETSLRELYEWNAALLSLAARTVDIAGVLERDRTGAAHERLSALIEDVADVVPNQEVSVALRSACERLQPFRASEAQVITDIDSEFDELRQHHGGIASTIRRFHLRRMRLAKEILSHRDRS